MVLLSNSPKHDTMKAGAPQTVRLCYFVISPQSCIPTLTPSTNPDLS